MKKIHGATELQLTSGDYRKLIECDLVFVKVCDLFGLRFFDHELCIEKLGLGGHLLFVFSFLDLAGEYKLERVPIIVKVFLGIFIYMEV